MASLRTIGLLIAIVFVATGAAVGSWLAADYFYKKAYGVGLQGAFDIVEAARESRESKER